MRFRQETCMCSQRTKSGSAWSRVQYSALFVPRHSHIDSCETEEASAKFPRPRHVVSLGSGRFLPDAPGSTPGSAPSSAFATPRHAAIKTAAVQHHRNGNNFCNFSAKAIGKAALPSR